VQCEKLATDWRMPGMLSARPTDTLIANSCTPSASTSVSSRSFTISTGPSMARLSQNPFIVRVPLQYAPHWAVKKSRVA
jgi:hypothetical protein